MDKPLYDTLCTAMDKVFEAHSLETIKNHRETIPSAKDQFTSFCWSMFHVSKVDCNMFYNAGLNDTHILTALKRILSDFA